MWPARRQVLEDFPLARMAESDCLAESGEGFPIANIQNVLVVAGHHGRGIPARCAAPRPPPHPHTRPGSASKEGRLPPLPRGLAPCRPGGGGGGPGARVCCSPP